MTCRFQKLITITLPSSRALSEQIRTRNLIMTQVYDIPLPFITSVLAIISTQTAIPFNLTMVLPASSFPSPS